MRMVRYGMSGSGFNRYIVECKEIISYGLGSNRLDLIDTLWNVKIICLCLCSPLHNDLIDTLWNVKQGHTAAFSLTAGFNRYIVECKGIYLAYTGS